MAADDDAAVWDRLPELLALAMALTGRPDESVELVGAAVQPSTGRRRRTALADPVVAARNRVVQRHLDRRRGPESPPPPTESSLPAELELIARQLGELTRLQRATLVLSHRERLTYAEIAGVVDRPVAAVGRSITEATSRLDAAPYEIVATLDALADAAPAADAVRPAARRHAERARHRRNRTRLAVTTGSLIVVAAVLVPTVVVPRLPVPMRSDNVWAFGAEVAPPSGWKTSAHYLAPQTEVVVINPTSGDEQSCAVEVRTATYRPDEAEDPEPSPTGSVVKVNGRPGQYLTVQESGSAVLQWSYAAKGVARVSCDGQPDANSMALRVARGVTFSETPLLVPFAYSTMPTGQAVQFIGEYDGGSGLLMLDRTSPAQDSSTGMGVQVPAESPPTAKQTTTVNGRPADIYADDGSVAVCLPVALQLACVTGYLGEPAAEQLKPLRDQVLDFATDLRFASDLADRTTWFDAREAIPH